MLRAIDVLRALAPNGQKNYLLAFERGDEAMAKAGITTKLRLAHFLTQPLAETGGLKVFRENMNYSASRIPQVWPTRPEAVKYAGNPAGLANSVYANRMGNGPPSSGDGYRFIGTGLCQTTGRDHFEKLAKALGIDCVSNPMLLCEPEYALMPWLWEWTQGNCNERADRNSLIEISRWLNVGNAKSSVMPVGWTERQAWFRKVWAIVDSGNLPNTATPRPAAPSNPANEAKPDPEILALQKRLNRLGYKLDEDGLFGDETEGAVENFQAKHGLRVDGIAGTNTNRKLDQVIAEMDRPKVDPAPVPTPVPVPVPEAPPAGFAALIAAIFAALRRLFGGQ